MVVCTVQFLLFIIRVVIIGVMDQDYEYIWWAIAGICDTTLWLLVALPLLRTSSFVYSIYLLKIRTGGINLYPNHSALSIFSFFYSFTYQSILLCSAPPLFNSVAWHRLSLPTLWPARGAANQIRIQIREEGGGGGWWVIDTRLRGVYHKTKPKSIHISQFFCQLLNILQAGLIIT